MVKQSPKNESGRGESSFGRHILKLRNVIHGWIFLISCLKPTFIEAKTPSLGNGSLKKSVAH
jgi:hypothetical protein